MNVAAPVIANAPVFVISPDAVAVAAKVPETVEAPNTNAPASTTDTSFPVIMTAPVKLFVDVFNVTSLPLAEIVVVPGITSAPDCVTAPPAVTERLLDKVKADRASAVVSVTVTLASVPPEAKESVLPKLFVPVSRVISVPFAVAVKLAAPVIANAPLSVILPVVAVAVN